jgi:hypothetical protein
MCDECVSIRCLALSVGVRCLLIIFQPKMSSLGTRRIDSARFNNVRAGMPPGGVHLLANRAEGASEMDCKGRRGD